MDKDTCPQCFMKPSSGRYWISCSQCEQWFHCVCVGVGRAAAKNIDWVCERCTPAHTSAQILNQTRNFTCICERIEKPSVISSCYVCMKLFHNHCIRMITIEDGSLKCPICRPMLPLLAETTPQSTCALSVVQTVSNALTPDFQGSEESVGTVSCDMIPDNYNLSGSAELVQTNAELLQINMQNTTVTSIHSLTPTQEGSEKSVSASSVDVTQANEDSLGSPVEPVEVLMQDTPSNFKSSIEQRKPVSCSKRLSKLSLSKSSKNFDSKKIKVSCPSSNKENNILRKSACGSSQDEDSEGYHSFDQDAFKPKKSSQKK